METPFATLASFQLAMPSRLLGSACCPDKDLVVIITHVGNRDRISLWKMQGSKKWEVDVDSNGHTNDEIVAMAWSPDCQNIALAHDPPRISIHSVQDGREERLLTIRQNLRRPSLRLTSIFWFQKERPPPSPNTIPDILKRNNDIPGSAHSMLKVLPLLDPLQDDLQPLTATDLFAFQGSSKRASVITKFPDVIASWPTLPSDPVAASIKAHHVGSHPGEELDEVDDRNTDSILCVGDDMGNVHCFLDGSFPLGTLFFNTNYTTASLFKDHEKPIFFAHHCTDARTTDLAPTVVKLPLLESRIVRDVARTSSAVRELTWYIMRSVKEIRTAWFGSELQSGARELGPKWIKALEVKQKDQFGQKEPAAVLDLTCLLLTGRASEALSDFLGSGDQMSDRGINKWESTIIEALTKLRDHSEKKVSPACQRLHLLVEEVQGWAQLPAFAFCEFNVSDAEACLQAIGRGILLASWLASAARLELARFKEFMAWLRYEITKSTQPEAANHPPPRFDILQVNDYMTSGLVDSQIDKWFLGPVPKFSAEDFNIAEPNTNLAEVLERAHRVANDPAEIAWRHNIKRKDLSGLERNLDSLIQEVSMRSSRLFSRTANATCASATVFHEYKTDLIATSNVPLPSDVEFIVCERTTRERDGQPGVLQRLAIRMEPCEEKSFLLARVLYGSDASQQPLRTWIALLDCSGKEEGSVQIDVVNAEFFDDESLVLVYKSQDQASTSIGTVSYAELAYQELPLDGEYVKRTTRERLMMAAIEMMKEEKISSTPISIKQSRTLVGCQDGGVTLAMNGRTGRRVACVLDSKGLGFEILDMEGEGEGEEELTTTED